MRCFSSARLVFSQIRPWVQRLSPEQASQTLDEIKRSRTGGWFLPGGAAGKTQITDKELEHMENLRNSLAPPEAGMTPTPSPEGPAGEQTEFPFAQGPNPKEFVERLRSGVTQFGKQFNEQTIGPYNEAIQQALTAIKNLAAMPTLSPGVEETGNQLLQLFQQIQAAGAEDAQLVSQLAQVAQQLAASATGAALAPNAPEAFSEGWYEGATEPQSAAQPATQPATAPQRPLLYDRMNAPQQNWLQRLKNWAA